MSEVFKELANAIAATADVDRKVFTVHQASTYSSLSRGTIYRAMADGSLPSIKVRGSRRIFKRDLDAFLENSRTAGTERPPASGTRPAA